MGHLPGVSASPKLAKREVSVQGNNRVCNRNRNDGVIRDEFFDYDYEHEHEYEYENEHEYEHEHENEHEYPPESLKREKET